MLRPGWDEYFLDLALAVSKRADCRRAQHGAVIVDADRRVVSTGYNGSPPGGPSCLAGECPRAASETPHYHPDYSDCIALHAEQNAIAYADRSRTGGASLYVTGPPCDMCSKLIKAAGIVRVVEGIRDVTNLAISNLCRDCGQPSRFNCRRACGARLCGACERKAGGWCDGCRGWELGLTDLRVS